MTGLVLLSNAETGRARGDARRGRGDGAPHGGRGGARGRDALPRGRRVRRRRSAAASTAPRRRACSRARGTASLSGTSTRRADAAVADELGARVAGSLAEALAGDIVVTVTPGRRCSSPPARCGRASTSSLMGADGPGKAEVAVDGARARTTSSATTGSRRATAASCRGRRGRRRRPRAVTEIGARARGRGRGPARARRT